MRRSIQKIWLKSFSRGSLTMTPARKSKTIKPFTYYTASISSSDYCLEYCFVIQTENGVFHYNQGGITKGLERQSANFKLLQDCQLPVEFYGRTFYQIFPDRFCNKNPELTPEQGQIKAHGHLSKVRGWTQKPLEYLQGYCLDYFGGDLPGIESKLNYLNDLGVDGVYLNPIFEAPTHHKYDCQDYYKVDPYLGGDDALSNLSRSCRQLDTKLMLDISVNHTGITHDWKNSKPDFYHKTEGGIHRWAGVDTLLTLDYENEDVHKTIYSDNNSVLKYWLKEPFNIDAWRFDVAHCMAREGNRFTHIDVWRNIRQHLKPYGNPYLLAEFWDDGRDFLNGDMWDASMNYYGFCRPVRLFFGEPEWQIFRHLHSRKREFIEASTFAKLFLQALEVLPFQIQNLQYNLLNSHDIHRMSSYSATDLESQIQTASLLMFHPGIANIYYGEEVALEGHYSSVEGCRYPMQWNENLDDHPLKRIYKKLGRMRRHAIFKLGSYRIIWAKGGTFIAVRFDDKDYALLIINRDSERSEITLDMNPYLHCAQRSFLSDLFSR